MRKYFLIIIFVSILLFGLTGIVNSQEKPYPTIVQDYPLLKACQNNEKCKPGQAGFGLPQFIKYIFIFSLGAVGLVGLLAIIMASFGYLMSVGNPQKASDAKDKIISALLGLLLLLGSYVALNMVNPDFLKLKVEYATPVEVTSETPTSDTCQCQEANWDKGVINVGESAILAFSLNKKCEGEKTIKFLPDELHLRQEGQDAVEFSHLCSAPTRNGLKINWTCTFKESSKGYFKNTYEGKPERFYLTGSFTINGVDQFLSENLYITVNDLKSDGTCCK